MRLRPSGVVALFLGAATVEGQGLSAPQRGDRFASTAVGAPFFTDVGPNVALVRDRRTFMVSWQRERVLFANPRGALSWSAEIPVALVVPRKHAPESECFYGLVTHKRYCFPVDAPKRPFAAVGVTPLGLRASLNGQAGIRPFASLAVGAVLFDRAMPVKAASAFNFAIDYTLGAELLAPSGKLAITVAWRFQHWSNAGATKFNPGLEANLLQIGLKRKRP